MANEGRGFALPITFTSSDLDLFGDSLKPGLTRNFEYITWFMNTYVPQLVDGTWTFDFPIEGDIVSANWDGADPPVLTSRDVSASAGYAIDSSEGSMQLEGSLFVEGDIDLSGASTLSANYVAGTSGFILQGDGSAEFNDVTIRGDIESANWDGASPANLTTRDATATAGFYLDSSTGSAQFMGDLFIGGTVLEGATQSKNLFVAGKLKVGGTSWDQEPWGPANIETLFGSFGSQGNNSTWVSWNYERGVDSAHYNRGVNSHSEIAAIELGNLGLRFRFEDAAAPTAAPNEVGRINATSWQADDGSTGLVEIFPKGTLISMGDADSETDIATPPASNTNQTVTNQTIACDYASQPVYVHLIVEATWKQVTAGTQYGIFPVIGGAIQQGIKRMYAPGNAGGTGATGAGGDNVDVDGTSAAGGDNVDIDGVSTAGGTQTTGSSSSTSHAHGDGSYIDSSFGAVTGTSASASASHTHAGPSHTHASGSYAVNGTHTHTSGSFTVNGTHTHTGPSHTHTPTGLWDTRAAAIATTADGSGNVVVSLGTFGDGVAHVDTWHLTWQVWRR